MKSRRIKIHKNCIKQLNLHLKKWNKTENNKTLIKFKFIIKQWNNNELALNSLWVEFSTDFIGIFSFFFAQRGFAVFNSWLLNGCNLSEINHCFQLGFVRWSNEIYWFFFFLATQNSSRSLRNHKLRLQESCGNYGNFRGFR